MEFRRRAAAAFVIIDHNIERKKNKKRKVRWWMKEIYRNRIQYGVQLMEEMRFEAVDETIKNFTRLSTEDYELLKSLIEPTVKKN